MDRPDGSACLMTRLSNTLYAGVAYHQTASAMAAPMMKLSAARNIRRHTPPRPHDEETDGEREDRRLPDREMERLEPRAAMTSDEKQRHDAHEIGELNECRADDGTDELLRQTRRKREDRGDHEKRGLNAVAAVADVDSEARCAEGRADDVKAGVNDANDRAALHHPIRENSRLRC